MIDPRRVALTVRARGPLAADEAWERYALPELWPTWSPQIRGVTGAPQRLSAGVTGRVHGPLGVSVDFVVDKWDELARTWSWAAWRGPIRLFLEHGVIPTDNGSETWLRAHGPLPIVVAYLPVARLALHRLVR